MTLRKLPEIKALEQPGGFQWDVPATALARWCDMPVAKNEGKNTITIYDVIGEDSWTGGGFTAKQMSAALASAGHGPVTVKINSPGGNVFEGFAIYNELRKHRSEIKIEVMGIAASAAAYIAMAGDTIGMARASFMMVHNAWGMVVGNRHDLSDSISVLEKIDSAMVDIFSARSGRSRADVEKLLDAETYLSAEDAHKIGFADVIFDGMATSDAKAVHRPEINARRRLDALLAQSGMPRIERRKMLREASAGVHIGREDNAANANGDLAVLEALLVALRA